MPVFVVIYTPGPNWIQGKSAVDQPYFREHGRYMWPLFKEKRVLMGGPFMDDTGGLGIINTESETEAQRIIDNDPAVLMKVFQPSLHPWHPMLNVYADRDLKPQPENV